MHKSITPKNSAGELRSIQEIIAESASEIIFSLDAFTCLHLYTFSIESGIPFELLLTGFDAAIHSSTNESSPPPDSRPPSPPSPPV